MAKQFAIYTIAFVIPLLALLSHHELKRILMEELILTFKTPSQVMKLLLEPTDPLYHDIQKAVRMKVRERWLAYEKLYRQTGEVWIGVFGLLYGIDVVWQGQVENEQKQQDAERLLRQATELSERDKDNAFPMLTKAFALFTLKRDNEALTAFHEAATRPNFRTYANKYAQLNAGRTFVVEERVLRLWAGIFPPPSALRETVRKVVTYSAQAEKEGDFERALNLAEDVIKVGAKMKKDGFFITEALVGIAIQSIAFAGETRKFPPDENRMSTPKRRVEHLKLLAQRFSEFAEKHGRKDLAELALKEAEEGTKIRLLVRQNTFENLLVVPVRRLTTARLTSFALLMSSLALALIGLISAAFLWRIPVAIDSYSHITATLVVAGLPLAAVIWGVFWTLNGELSDIIISGRAFFGVISLTLAIVLLLFAVCFLPALWQLRGRKVDRYIVAALIGVPAFSGALTIGVVNTPIFKASSPLLTILLFLSLIALTAFVFFIAWGVWARFGSRDDRHIYQGALARLRGAAVLLLLICWWGYAVVGFSSLPVRTKLHQALDDIITQGELAFIQREIGSSPNKN